MASNSVKKLEVGIADLHTLIEDAIKDKLEELIEEECTSMDGLGDDGTTELEYDACDITVTKEGKVFVDIYFNRTTGKFVSNGELEEAVISRLSGSSLDIQITHEIEV